MGFVCCVVSLKSRSRIFFKYTSRCRYGEHLCKRLKVLFSLFPFSSSSLQLLFSQHKTIIFMTIIFTCSPTCTLLSNLLPSATKMSVFMSFQDCKLCSVEISCNTRDLVFQKMVHATHFSRLFLVTSMLQVILPITYLYRKRNKHFMIKNCIFLSIFLFIKTLLSRFQEGISSEKPCACRSVHCRSLDQQLCR